MYAVENDARLDAPVIPTATTSPDTTLPILTAATSVDSAGHKGVVAAASVSAAYAHKDVIPILGNDGLSGSPLCSLSPADLASSTGDPATAALGATGINVSAGSHATGIATEDIRKHTLHCLTEQMGSLGGVLLEAAGPIHPDAATTASSSSDATPVTTDPSIPDPAAGGDDAACDVQPSEIPSTEPVLEETYVRKVIVCLAGVDFPGDTKGVAECGGEEGKGKILRKSNHRALAVSMLVLQLERWPAMGSATTVFYVYCFGFVGHMCLITSARL